MALDKISVSSSDYVVLDVETNGLKSKEHDLLSLSIFKPDDGKEFDRFFPLDLNSEIPSKITAINGIKKSHVKGKDHLTQEEFDALVAEFELDTRTILHYGDIDMRFVRDYLFRQGIKGFEKLRFFNFKKRICSSGFSSGNLTKDNLCKMFGIEGVEKVHSGINDCKLEWKLFQKMDGDYLLVTSGFMVDNVFRLNEDYIVPVSFLSSYSKLSKLYDRPYIVQDSEVVYHEIFSITDAIRRFDTNISGISIENLINAMLDVERLDSKDFLIKNKMKLSFVGTVGSNYDVVPVSLNDDGSVTTYREQDKDLEDKINKTNKLLEPLLMPVVEFIRSDVFKNKQIFSQELMVYEDMGILALCDLSTEDAILEIKTGSADPEKYKEQLFYEANGREAYVLFISFERRIDSKSNTNIKRLLDLKVYKVRTSIGRKPNKRKDKVISRLNSILKSKHIEVYEYKGGTAPIKLRCLKCNDIWSDTKYKVENGKVFCAKCYPELMLASQRFSHSKNQHRPYTDPITKKKLYRSKRVDSYISKIQERSSGTISIREGSYKGSKERITASCNVCGHVWTPRADYLLSKCYCPKCKKISNWVLP